MAGSHDQNFKNLILDYPLQALAFFAAEEAHGLQADPVRITPIRQEQLKERLSERFRELDVPLLVEWPDGRREALLFVLEEETDPRRFSIHRLAHYCLDLAALFKTDRVVPVVIFLKTAPEQPPHLSLGSDLHSYLQFRYIRCALSELWARDYWTSDNLVACLNLPNMRWSEDEKLHVYARAIRQLLALEPDPEKQIKYLEFVDIYTALTDNERQCYAALYPEEDRIVNGFAQRFIEQGLEKGRVYGELQILERLLQRRFGAIDVATRARLSEATCAELERWAENVLEARTLAEVFEGDGR